MATTSSELLLPKLKNKSFPTIAKWLLLPLPFLAIGFFIMSERIFTPNSTLYNPSDENVFFWLLQHAVQALQGNMPWFYDYSQGLPDGVNLAANVSILPLGILAAPITIWFGPEASYLTLFVLAYASTGVAWFVFFRKALNLNLLACWIGSIFLTISPSMLEQGNAAHLNLTFQAVIPFVIWAFINIVRQNKPIKNGIFLGLTSALQYYINAEVLFMTFVSIAIFGVLFYNKRLLKFNWRNFVISSVIGAGITLILCGYAMYLMFFGKGGWSGVPENFLQITGGLSGFLHISPNTLVGQVLLVKQGIETNLFLGATFIIVLVILLFVLNKVKHFWSLIATILVLGFFSSAPILLPVFNNITPSRWGLMAMIGIGILLALMLNTIKEDIKSQDLNSLAIWGILTVGLISLTPVPLKAYQLDMDTPSFIKDKSWEQFVDIADEKNKGSIYVLGAPAQLQLRWNALQENRIPLAGGYYHGGDEDRINSSVHHNFLLMRVIGDSEKQEEIDMDIHSLSIEDKKLIKQDLINNGIQVVLIPTGVREMNNIDLDTLSDIITDILEVPVNQNDGVLLWQISGEQSK